MSLASALFARHPDNPIVQPGLFPWRRCAVFNPGVVRDDDGTFYMLERAVERLAPFRSQLGLLRSDDGVRFTHVRPEPVFTSDQVGYPHGGIQDPRVVKIGDRFILVYVLRKWCANCRPTGIGLPDYEPVRYPGQDPAEPNNSRSGIAVSADMVRWEHVAWITPDPLDDRDNILFPEKIGGRYCLLRRPLEFVGPAYGTEKPAMWLSWSEDLLRWSEPVLLAKPEFAWEGKKIGGSTQPVRTAEGWLVTYHGVDERNRYCLGALLLDLADPTRVLYRTPEPIMVPELYYERCGLVIQDCIFPNSNVLVGDTLYLYYGACDTAIALATAPLAAILAELRRHPWRG